MFLARRKGWIGVDLGPRTLRLAQVERVGTGVRLAASAVVRDPGDNGDMHAPDAACHPWHADDVRAALSLDRGFSGRTAACVMPMNVTEVSVLTVPPAAEAERRAIIANELASAFPDDPEEREFDFWEAAAAASPNGTVQDNVNVLSVSRPVAYQAIRSLSDAGLRCEVMDGLPFALARAVDMAYGPDPRVPVAAVDWGYACGTFSIVSGGKPQFTRILRSCGFGLAVEQVRQALALSEDEAVQVLADYGLPGPGCRGETDREIQIVVREVTAPQFNELSEELNKTISYLRAKYADIVPQRLCLFGEGAIVRHVAAAVSERLGLPADVWRMLGSDGEGSVPNNLTPLLGTAVALSRLAWP